MAGLDIIGDIHGHATELHSLLKLMDYVEVDGAYQHPERIVIFLGDFIDRGNEQLEVLRIVRAMCKAGHARAIMGNHEFNAIGWCIPDGRGDYLRRHTPDNRDQHEQFLRQIVAGSEKHQDTIRWFKSLPILLDLMSVRAVHACWHMPSLQNLSHCLNGDNSFTDTGIIAAFQKGTAEYDAAEILLKGPEKELPDNLEFRDKGGKLRRHGRIRWWDKSTTELRSLLIGLEGAEKSLPPADLDISEYYYHDETPVFFGHYWLNGIPRLEAENAVCLDYSVAKGGHLVAYRWNDTKPLDSSFLIGAPAISPADKAQVII
jgi:Calcineurin-like phosphoesterase